MEKEEQIQMLGEGLKVLMMFAAQLIPELPLLEEYAESASSRESYTLSAAPLLTAMGIDFEQKNSEWQLQRKRVNALINFLKVLEETEKERQEFNQKAAGVAEARNQLAAYLGM